MKNIILIASLFILFFSTSTIQVIAKNKYPKCLYSCLIRSDGSIIQTFDKIQCSILTSNEINSLKGDQREATESNFKVFPNPMNSECVVSLSISKKSDVEIYYFDKINAKNIIYEGNLNIGQHEFPVSTLNLKSGMNIFYSKVNEKITIVKTIRL